MGGVCGRSLTEGKILFTGRQTCSLYLVLWLCDYDPSPNQLFSILKFDTWACQGMWKPSRGSCWGWQVSLAITISVGRGCGRPVQGVFIAMGAKTDAILIFGTRGTEKTFFNISIPYIYLEYISKKLCKCIDRTFLFNMKYAHIFVLWGNSRLKSYFQ